MTVLNIRRLTTVEAFNHAVDLQTIYWGTDGDALVPMHMLHSIANYGGHILGAYDDDRLVGFVMGFIGTNIDYELETTSARDALLIMSKRMVVLPEYRGQNIGYLLKMEQRDVAIKQGIPLVTWTFDPLLAPNAYLNIRKLGGIARNYKVDYFGKTDQAKLQADRLVVELWVDHPRLLARAENTVEHISLHDYIQRGAKVINRAVLKDEYAHPSSTVLQSDWDTILVEIPSNFRDLDKYDSGLAQAWRDHIREILVSYLSDGFIVTDFVREHLDVDNRTYYILSRSFDDGDDK